MYDVVLSATTISAMLTGAVHDITDVEPAYYQDRKTMFPVVIVNADRTKDDGSGGFPIERYLMISLVEGFTVDEPYGDLIHARVRP